MAESCHRAVSSLFDRRHVIRELDRSIDRTALLRVRSDESHHDYARARYGCRGDNDEWSS